MMEYSNESNDGEETFQLLENVINENKAQVTWEDFDILSFIGKGNLGEVFAAHL